MKWLDDKIKKVCQDLMDRKKSTSATEEESKEDSKGGAC